jgi:tetratricopeptide (TPR) repeat protein
MKSYLFLLISALLLISYSCDVQSDQPANDSDAVLGQLGGGFTLNPAVQDKFDEGLLLLHNFEYDDALTLFEEASAIDSTEIMTIWGEAMCHYKALWRLQNTDNGKAVLARLGDSKEVRMASIEDELEKEMWEVVEIMYGSGDFETRNMLIKSHLSALHRKYPSHQEIAAFYALSLVWATEHYGDGSDDLRLAASIADEIIAVNPLHPGALHYKIHALDGPVSAKDAVEAADAYAKVAPDAAHALHMPSHIYLALGEWDGVVSSNEKSYVASVKRMEELGLSDGARGYHSLAWWHYGLLQKGKFTEAELLLNEMLSHVPKDPTKGARTYLLGMQSSHFAEKGSVDKETALDLEVKVDDLNIISKAARSFLRAQLAYQNEDIDEISTEIDWLSSKIYMDSLNIQDSGIAMCAAGNSRYSASPNSIKMAQVVLNQLEGMQALLDNNEALFEAKMNKAVTIELETDYPTGPPKITKPSFEQYGEWLLEKGRYQDAKKQFENALARMPRRAKSLEGKYAALEALEQSDKALEIQEELEAIYGQRDTEGKQNQGK